MNDILRASPEGGCFQRIAILVRTECNASRNDGLGYRDRSIGNEVAAWLIAIEDAGLFMYVKVLRQAG